MSCASTNTRIGWKSTTLQDNYVSKLRYFSKYINNVPFLILVSNKNTFPMPLFVILCQNLFTKFWKKVTAAGDLDTPGEFLR